MTRGESVQRFRTQRRCKDGTRRDVSVTMSAVLDESGRLTSVSTVARDITEQNRIEMALLESEGLHRAMFDEAPVGVALLDRDGRCLRANARLAELLRYDLHALPGVQLAEVAPPEDVGRDAAVAGQLWSGVVSRHSEERRLRCADGTSIWARVSATVHRRREEAMGFLVVVEDITEAKLAQTQLAQVFELSPDMLCTATLDGYLTKVNPAFSQVLGFSAEVLIGRPFIEFVHPEDRAATMAQMERLRRGEQTSGFTNRYVTDTGAYRTLSWHSRCDPAAGLIYAVARDQTEQQRLEEQIRQMQKIDAVGQLAGGVAHDFNNILTAIVGFGDLALHTLHRSDPARREVAEILKAADSASTLTRQLLAFSRRQLLRPEALDVETVVTDMTGMLRRLVGAPVDLSVRCQPAIPRALADHGQLQQVLLNLVVNARDALPEGGTVTIEVDAVDLDATYAASRPGMQPGAYIVLSVSDNGTGMSEQVRQRLFEPFFTTKARGKGTGLGLATVYGIVKQSGGYISVYSEPGIGSTFKVYLPQAADSAWRRDEPLPVGAPTGGQETVLVVEDQEDVRRVICEVLTRHGYTTLAVASGHEALQAIDRHMAQIGLVVTDVVLPDLSGPEMAGIIVDRRRDLPVLFMSGYTENAIVHTGVLERGLMFLEKPFTAASLLRAVRAAIDRPTDLAAG